MLEAELQALLKPKKAASGRKAPKCSKCGNPMNGIPEFPYSNDTLHASLTNLVNSFHTHT